MNQLKAKCTLNMIKYKEDKWDKQMSFNFSINREINKEQSNNKIIY